TTVERIVVVRKPDHEKEMLVRLLRGWLTALVLGWAASACVPPPAPVPAPMPEPRVVVETYLAALQRGDAEAAQRQWGFASDAFRAQASPADEEAIRRMIVRQSAARQPQAYHLGETLPSSRSADRRYVEVWLSQPPLGAPGLYDMARTAEGWRIVGYTPPPSPPRRQP
ncbi:MAG: hypothetical protein NTZ05_21210, partial [Chloroflexi bacterium]|nr:hypothetical protein [Chloroflexota bacterium]